ncbi:MULTISPECIES: radical SAM protein [Methylococcus]|uniref:Radical SAM protein n=1 Tax=Methylococcus capsulatus TaxID=414 RepID=A0ABZ2F802_METCP|nr:radical SAM protein [Methylococcus capsulatus]MDF9391179.1 radical SAM protein [Methylococcus capsulatus]
MSASHRLSVSDHSRDSAGLRYVYPVLSRRSGGLSLGINLNPNNACNWRCIYCQVPGLRRGGAPAVDVALLAGELEGFLADVLEGDFFERYGVPDDQRRIRDIAISGNGEPTGAVEFEQVIEAIGRVAGRFGLPGRTGFVLITNGSGIERLPVQQGLKQWAALGGEVWFKLDSATAEGIRRINNAHLKPQTVRRRIEACAKLCPTWLQTCMFAMDGAPPSGPEQEAYLAFLSALVCDEIPVHGVLLYGLARPSLQPESVRLARLPAEALEAFGAAIRERGLAVRVTP